MPTNPAAVTINELQSTHNALNVPSVVDPIVKQPVPLAYNLHAWQRVKFGSNATATSAYSALSADNAYMWLAAKPLLPNLAEQVGYIEKADPSYETAFKFFGTGANDTTMTAKIWGLAPLKDGNANELMGDPLCTLSMTLGGGTVYGSRALGNPTITFRMVEAITFTKDFTIQPKILRVGHDGTTAAVDACEVIVIDRAPGYVGFIVEMLIGTATGWGALYKG